jgi:hypothetical protein
VETLLAESGSLTVRVNVTKRRVIEVKIIAGNFIFRFPNFLILRCFKRFCVYVVCDIVFGSKVLVIARGSEDIFTFTTCF